MIKFRYGRSQFVNSGVKGLISHFLPQLQDGYIVYTYTNSLTPQQFFFNDVAVDDGQWHYFEARWRESGHLIMLLDYGQRQVGG